MSALVDAAKDVGADLKEDAKDIAVTVVKMLAGAEIGAGFGPFGAIAGAVGGFLAGFAEGSASSADHQPSADNWRQREEEHGPPAGNYGVVITPPEVPQPLETTNKDPTKNEIAASLIQWPGLTQDKLVDRANQLWWGGDEQFRGYQGRWGVRVQNDPNLRRSGRPSFPTSGGRSCAD